jgi:hypothetical protein
MEITAAVLTEWQIAFDEGNEPPEHIMAALFSLAIQKQQELETQ